MSLSSSVVGQTYGLFQVSDGTATAGSNGYNYTEGDFEIGPATVTAYSSADNSIMISFDFYGSTYQTIKGTVIGNTASSFLVSGTATLSNGYQFPITTYLTNSTGGQQGFGSTITVPFESANITYTPACYCRGARIAVPGGEKQVEELTAGDLVVTAAGEHRPVVWVGRRSYARRFLAANPAIQPVRFRAGSLGGGLPRRDLLVSPNHSMFLDGLLVPAHCLVNGTTVVQERGLDQVDYFHVELDSHDVILAEGALSESFVDDGSRGVFHNAAEWQETNPDRAPMAAVFCAPKVESGPALEAIRRRLNPAAGEVAQAA